MPAEAHDLNRLEAVWSVPFDAFMGVTVVSQKFEIDGRGGDYDHVFDWDSLTEPLWASEDGKYAVFGLLDDFEPDCVVLKRENETVGFYLDGGVWIDPEHRGRKLAPEMILAAIAWQGRPLHDNRQGKGFSPAGHAAHLSAHRLAVARAREAGLQIPDHEPDGRMPLF